MKKQLSTALLIIATTQAAENKIDLSNANNELLSLYLSYVPAEHPLISELTKTRSCDSNLYDRIVEAYLYKTKKFYIEEKDIKDITESNFSTSANSKIDSKIYQNRIYEALKRYNAKYPYILLLNAIESSQHSEFANKINKDMPVYNQYQSLNLISDAKLDDELDSMSEKDLLELLTMLKIEKKLINNLYEYSLSPKKINLKFNNHVRHANASIAPKLFVANVFIPFSGFIAMFFNNKKIGGYIMLSALAALLCSIGVIFILAAGNDISNYSSSYTNYLLNQNLLLRINTEIKALYDKINNKVEQIRNDKII